MTPSPPGKKGNSSTAPKKDFKGAKDSLVREASPQISPKNSATAKSIREQKSEHHLEREKAYNELVDQLKLVGGISDDFAKRLAQNWKKLLGVAFLLICGVWLVGAMREGHKRKVATEADQFASAQDFFSSAYLSQNSFEPSTPSPAFATAPSTEDEERKARALRDRLTYIEKSGSGALYNSLSALYLAIVDLEQGNIKQARQGVLAFNIDRYKNLQAPSEKKEKLTLTFIDELATLIYVRTLIADQSGGSEKANLSEARDRLTGLAYGSASVPVEAVVMLYRIADTKEGQEQAVKVAGDLIVARPELREILEAEFSNFGVGLVESS